MKYKLNVTVFMTYFDKDIEVEVELTDEEVARIKELVATNVVSDEEPEDDEAFMPKPDLLQILEENDAELFEKFWDVIMPPVFVEMLINGFENGNIEKDRKDNFDDYYEAPFDKLYAMYGEDIELEHSSCCRCSIPEEFAL